MNLFEKAFNISEIANFTAQQRDDYGLSSLRYLEVVSLKKEMEMAIQKAEHAEQKVEAKRDAEQKVEQAKQDAEQKVK